MDLAAHQRVGGRRVGGKQHRLRRRLLLPVVLGHHLALEHRARPGRAAGRRDHVADLLVAVVGLGEVDPGLRRVLHQLGIVGDRPDHGGARPQLLRHARLRDVVGGVRRRVVREQVLDLEHQRAVGMVDHVGEQLAGRGLGLHALQQLIARRAQELDLDEGKALVERVDDRRFALGHVGAVEDELAFLARRLDQLGRAELGVRGAGSSESANARCKSADGVTGSLAIPVDLVPFFDPFPVQRLELLRTSAPTPWCPWSCRRAAAAAP